MPGISIHVVDVSRGVVANGMKVEVFAAATGAEPRLVASGLVAANGVVPHPALEMRFEPGFYAARFHVADFYRAATGASDATPFLDVPAIASALPTRMLTTTCP